MTAEHTEDRNPLWVCCGECDHKWIGLYMPIEASRLNKIVSGMCCPSCANDSKGIYMTKPPEAEDTHDL